MKLKKIINKIKNNHYSKYFFIFIVVFFVSFGVNYFLIESLESHINEKQITYTDFTVINKSINSENGHYIVIGDDNVSYEVMNDKNGADIFNHIEVGNHYHFTVRNDSNFSYIHIIQVYDEKQ